MGAAIGGANIRSATVVAAAHGDPEYCKVAARIDPALNFEVRLPATWNQKVVFMGGGGYDGLVPTPGAGASPGTLKKGYTTIATDSGHQGSQFNASWALNNPEAVDNFAYLATHRVLMAAREIIVTRYAAPIRRAYFEGGSTGGREALIEAQRWPNDFDGVIAREPVQNFTALQLATSRIVKQVFATPGGFLSLETVQTLGNAVLSACDGLDGLEDGIISNVAACHFDPAVLRCTGPASDSCLTDEQINTVNLVHSDLHLDFELAHGVMGYPRWPVGGEESASGWLLWITGPSPEPPASFQFALHDQFIKYFVTKDPQFDTLQFSPEAYTDTLQSVSQLLDATDPDLSALTSHGGKLILWHGWTDYGVSAYSTVEYYDRVVSVAGGQANADQFVRLYTSPGVDHLGMGPGGSILDLLGALDAWVEEGTAPGDLIASKLDPTTNAPIPFRPLCRYPRYPRYNGSGAENAASSFSCALP